jgi:hypothetical protein
VLKQSDKRNRGAILPVYGGVRGGNTRYRINGGVYPCSYSKVKQGSSICNTEK